MFRRCKHEWRIRIDHWFLDDSMTKPTTYLTYICSSCSKIGRTECYGVHLHPDDFPGADAYIGRRYGEN